MDYCFYLQMELIIVSGSKQLFHFRIKQYLKTVKHILVRNTFDLLTSQFVDVISFLESLGKIREFSNLLF